MARNQIVIKTKLKGQSTQRVNIDVTHETENVAPVLKEIGDNLVGLNPNADIDVSFYSFNSISDTWMEMIVYYANESRIVNL